MNASSNAEFPSIRASFFFPAPNACATNAVVAIPSAIERVMNANSRGKTKLIAANGIVPSFPTKKTSARLNRNIPNNPSTVGHDKRNIWRAKFPCVKNARFS